jgi:hypothetical protein
MSEEGAVTDCAITEQDYAAAIDTIRDLRARIAFLLEERVLIDMMHRNELERAKA